MVHPTKIFIKLEKKFNDELDFNGGKIYLDPTYRPEWNVVSHGLVHSVPLRNPNIDDEFVFNVQVGDKLYFNYGVVMDENNLIESGGEEYWAVDYFLALAVVRDGKVYPVGEHILIEPMEEEMKNDFLIIPDSVKKVVPNKGRVFSSNDNQVPQNSMVMFEERGKFENEIEGKNLFVMFNSNILAIVN
jgi:co-chaperonin GroES (HSP10)